MKSIKVDHIESNKQNDKQLVTVIFRDKKGVAYSWMPTWELVRELLQVAIYIEVVNSEGGETLELMEFNETVRELHKFFQMKIGLEHNVLGMEVADAKDWAE